MQKRQEELKTPKFPNGPKDIKQSTSKQPLQKQTNHKTLQMQTNLIDSTIIFLNFLKNHSGFLELFLDFTCFLNFFKKPVDF